MYVLMLLTCADTSATVVFIQHVLMRHTYYLCVVISGNRDRATILQ